MPITLSPRSSRRLAVWKPIKPALPVTSIFMGVLSSCGAFRQAGEKGADPVLMGGLVVIGREREPRATVAGEEALQRRSVGQFRLHVGAGGGLAQVAQPVVAAAGALAMPHGQQRHDLL